MAPVTLKNAAICSFFGQRLLQMPQVNVELGVQGSAFSVLWVTRDLLDNGTWQVFTRTEPIDPHVYFPDLEQRRAGGFVGTKVYGSGNVRKLVNAYFGLFPWDGFAESDYLDKLLLSPDLRPTNVLLTKNRPVSE